MKRVCKLDNELAGTHIHLMEVGLLDMYRLSALFPAVVMSHHIANTNKC